METEAEDDGAADECASEAGAGAASERPFAAPFCSAAGAASLLGSGRDRAVRLHSRGSAGGFGGGGAPAEEAGPSKPGMLGAGEGLET